MSSVVISGDTSGTVTLTVPSVAGTNTATLPAATGTIMVSGNMPAFSAYANSTQSMSNGIQTKIAYQVKEFDTNNNYDNTTNYRFTPTVAGYYLITGAVTVSGLASTLSISAYKNGSQFKIGSQSLLSSSFTVANISTIIYFNGSTDYVELYCLQQSGSSQNTYVSGAIYNYFQAIMVRGA